MDNEKEITPEENFGIILDEKELPDDYPVYGDYVYVADGKMIRSNIMEGTVRDLKRDLFRYYKIEVKVITNCDIAGRRKIIDAKAKSIKQ